MNKEGICLFSISLQTDARWATHRTRRFSPLLLTQRYFSANIYPLQSVLVLQMTK